MNHLSQSIRTGERVTIMVYHSATCAEMVTPEGEPNLDTMTQGLQSLLKCRNFYDHIDFTFKQRLAITKTIIKLTDPSRSQASSSGSTRR